MTASPYRVTIRLPRLKWLDSPQLPWIIIGLGITLRATQYFANKSLWMDESFLAINIVQRSFLQLVKPLDYGQGAPIGFLLVEKLAVETLGDNEYTLRILPFLASIASLFIFYKVAISALKAYGALIALGLFSISEFLILYSSEAKQYSTDVFIALILYVLGFYQLSRNNFTFRQVAMFGIIGSISIWFSHPSIFILSGLGAALVIQFLSKKNWLAINRLSIVLLCWFSSFLIFYLISLRHLTNHTGLQNYWNSGFIPFPPSKFSDIKSLIDICFKTFENPVGLHLSGLAALAFIIGCSSLFHEHRGKFWLLIWPIPFTLIASILHKYPFSGRLLLFLVPSILILVAEGTWQIFEKTKQKTVLMGLTFIFLLFLYPLLLSSYYLIKSPHLAEIKPVMGYIKEHYQNGDVLYLYYGAFPAFKYYEMKYGFTEDDYIVGVTSRNNWKNYKDDLERFRDHQRMWILFSHVHGTSDFNEEKLLLSYLDSMGTRLDAFKEKGAAAFLYDLTRPVLSSGNVR